jgi:hypothetical protein
MQKNLVTQLKYEKDRLQNELTNVFLTMLRNGTKLIGYGDTYDKIEEPELYGEAKTWARDLVLEIEDSIIKLDLSAHIFRKMALIREYEGEFHVEYEDSNYEIGNYLNILHKMIRFNLRSSIELAGRWLVQTSSFYYKQFFNRWLDELALELEN